MSEKTKLPPNANVKAKARQLLAFVQQESRECKTAAELFLVVFGSNGKASKLFHTEKDWAAFERTDENKEIHKLLQAMPAQLPGGMGGKHLTVTLHLPKSVHAALSAEAAAEGVSLDQLCMSKLVAQLRELV